MVDIVSQVFTPTYIYIGALIRYLRCDLEQFFALTSVRGWRLDMVDGDLLKVWFAKTFLCVHCSLFFGSTFLCLLAFVIA